MPQIHNNLCLSASEPKSRLSRIGEYVEDFTEGKLSLFCQYLAEQLPNILTPKIFLKEWEAATRHLRLGAREGGEKIEHPLVGEEGATFFLVWVALPKVIEAIFPPDFARVAKLISKEDEDKLTEGVQYDRK